MRSEVWARKEEVTNQEWGGVEWGPWAFGVDLTLYISLLCMPCFTVWRVRQHPMMDGSSHVGTWWLVVKWLSVQCLLWPSSSQELFL